MKRIYLLLTLLSLSFAFLACEEDDERLIYSLCNTVWQESAESDETFGTILKFDSTSFSYSIELPALLLGGSMTFKEELYGTYTYEHPMVILTFDDETKDPWILVVNEKELYYHGDQGINHFSIREPDQMTSH